MKRILAILSLTLPLFAWATDYVWNTSVKNGNWADAANWLVDGAATEAYPSSSSDTATFPAGSAATISLAAGYTLGGMTVNTSESANWRFVGTSDRYLKVTPQITGDGTGSVVFKRVSTGLNYSTMRSGALTLASAPKNLTFDQNCGWTFDGVSFPDTRITLLRHGALKGGWNASTFGDLAVYGENYAYCDKTTEFGSFIDMGGVACVEVKTGTLKFRNTSGITLIGGTQTLADGGSQIPVAPQFAVANAATDYASLGWNTALPLGACTLDADGVVRQIPTSTMKTSFDDAGELDNVYIGADATLTKDTTINAVVYGANIDLGGHTLTIKSGVLRPTARGGMWTISNGKVVTCEPMLLTDGVNNTNSRLMCDFATSGNNDPMKAMLNYVPMAGSVPQAATFADFTGAIIYQHGNTPLYSAGLGATGVFREISDTKSMSFDNHWMVVKGAGIGGNGSISATSKFNPQIILGDIGETSAANYNFYIGSGAVLAPGSLSEDGYRRGTLSCCYRTGNVNGFENITFFSGSKFQVVLRADGTATKLECQYGNYDKKYSKVTLAGALEIAEANRCPGEATWTILSVGREIAGAFDSVTEGYTVQYNVDLGTDANGIQLYGVQVTKNAVPEADNSVDFTEDEPTYDFTDKSLTIGGTATKIGDEADYVKATIEYGDTAELGSTIEQTTALGKDEKYTQTFEGPFAGAQKFYYRVTLTSNLKFAKTSAVHEFIAPVEIVVAEPVYDRGAGSITVSATADAATTATILYGETPELGKSEELGAFASGAAMAKTFSGYEPADTLYYKYSLLDANGTVTTTLVNQAIMPAGGELANVGASITNTQITITNTVAARGLGTVTINYYVGLTKGNLTLVGSHTLEDGESAEQSFVYAIGAEGNYYYAAEIVNEYMGETWATRTTSEEAIAVADLSPYTWKGGEGDWNNAAMWEGEVGAIGIPNAKSVVTIKPSVDSVITVTSGAKCGNIYLSTAKASVTFKGNVLPCGNVYMDSAAEAKALTFDGCWLGEQNASSKMRNIENMDKLPELVVANSAGAKLQTALSGTDVKILAGAALHADVNQPNMGKLTVRRSASRMTGTWHFASFESLGELPLVGVEDGKVSFDDTTGIELVGGSQTLESAGSQIPVAPIFAQAYNNNGWAGSLYGWGACTLSGGVVRAIPTSTMLQSVNGATVLDNVYVAASETMASDTTVNALLVSGSATLDLGGHTLTVKSGVVRCNGNSSALNIINGTLALERPTMFCDTLNNSTERVKANIVWAGAASKGEVAFCSQGGSYPSAARFANFAGTAYMKGTWNPSTTASTSLTVDFAKGGALGAVGHNCTYVIGEIAGSFGVEATKFNQVYWVGSTNGIENLRAKTHFFGIASGGKLALGSTGMDGYRHGSVKLTPSSNDLYGISYFETLGGTLEATLFKDGEATYLDATGATAWPDKKGIAVTLGGNLSLVAAGKLPANVEWPIVKTQRETTGCFANAGENGKGLPGYVVKYNVKQDDGTYAVVVMKKTFGFSIIVR